VISDSDRDRLVAAAAAARDHAVAPYSKFHVGAALLAEDGRIFTGVNVESASYGLTVCAERTAVFKALSEGARRFAAIVVATDEPRPTPPCGACRQVLWDQAGDLWVILHSVRGPREEMRLSALLPRPFEFKG
jgi:cytidine deaminase